MLGVQAIREAVERPAVGAQWRTLHPIVGRGRRVRFPLRITHSGSPSLKRPRASILLISPGGGYFRAPCGAGSLAVGKRSGCVVLPQGRTISGVGDAVSIRERDAHRHRIGSPVQLLRHAHRAARRLDPPRHRAPRRRAVRPHLQERPLAAAPAPGQRQGRPVRQEDAGSA